MFVCYCYSTGTGRTGTFIAIDLCMQAYDDSNTIDVMNTVHRLRQDRAGAVQSIVHYAFIYKVGVPSKRLVPLSCHESRATYPSNRTGAMACKYPLATIKTFY